MIGLTGATGSRVPMARAASNLLFGIVGFTIVGGLNPVHRFKHLFAAAMGNWLLGVVMVLAGVTSLAGWAASAIGFFSSALVGGALSYLFVRPRSLQEHKRVA